MPVHQTMQSQYGQITRQQARDHGLTNHQIDRLLRCREWIQVHRGVFRHAAVDGSYRGRVCAATLATDGVASHLCAAALHGLQVGRRVPVTVTIPRARRTPRIDSVVVHRTSQWDLIDRTTVHGITATGVDRTIIDCASVLDPDALERLAESAIRQRLTTWQSLNSTLETQGCRGRDGTAGLRQLLEHRLGDPVVPRSDFSRRVQHLLRDGGIPDPMLEYDIVDTDGTYLLMADLVWPAKMCALELDGMANHFNRVDRERDIHKRAKVRAAGWRVLEIGWELYKRDPAQVVELVRRLLASSPEIGAVRTR